MDDSDYTVEQKAAMFDWIMSQRFAIKAQLIDGTVIDIAGTKAISGGDPGVIGALNNLCKVATQSTEGDGK